MLAPTLKAGDIVIMDNLSAHKVEGVRKAIEAVGTGLVYRPPAPQTISPHRVDSPSEFEALRVNRRSSNVEHGLN